MISLCSLWHLWLLVFFFCQPFFCLQPCLFFLKENEIDPAVERLQASQVVEAENEIARSGVAVGVSNEELPFDLAPSRFAAGELIRPLQVEFRAAAPGKSCGEIARQCIRRGEIDYTLLSHLQSIVV